MNRRISRIGGGSLSIVPSPRVSLKKPVSLESRIGFKFRVISVFSILVLSLFGGFVWGLRNGPDRAEALVSPPVFKEGWKPRLVIAPSNLVIHSIGTNSEINGRPSESAVFQSSSDVKSVAAKIVSEWQLKGIEASGIAFSNRGAAFGISKDNRLRMSLGIWKNLQSGLTEGIISAAEISNRETNSHTKFVPGVPFPKDSKLGATYKASEQGEVSWSASLTAFGNINRVSDWYKRELAMTGWKNADSPSSSFLQFSRKNEELTLLFAPVPSSTSGEEVFISVIKKSASRES